MRGASEDKETAVSQYIIRSYQCTENVRKKRVIVALVKKEFSKCSAHRVFDLHAIHLVSWHT